MVEIKLVQEQDLTSDMIHVFSWKNKADRDSYFNKKKSISHIARIQATPNLTSLNVDMTMAQVAEYDYMYFENNGNRYYFFIENKIFKTEKITTLIVQLDYWTTYQFDIDLNSAFVERCHQDRWKSVNPSSNSVQKFIPNKFIDTEGLNAGEYKLTHTLNVCDMSDTVVYTSSVPLGYIGATAVSAGYESIDMWKEGKISSKGFRFIKGYEGFAPRNYKDPGGYYTIGYGVTKHGEKDIYNNHVSRIPVSEAYGAQQAYNLKNERYASKILNAFKALGCNNQDQFDALVSVAYNCGTGAVTGDNSLTRIIKKDPSNEQAIRAVWEKFKITSGGVVLSGLKARRKQECDMFFGKKVEMRPIAIINENGKVTSQKVTENDGHGWLPGSMTNTNEKNDHVNIEGYKEFSNAYGSGWLCPVKGVKVTSLFGNRKHPVTGVYRMHNGIDMGAPVGHETVATKAGTVTHVGWENPSNKSQGYGLRVWVEHSGGYRSVYAHLSKTSVKVGQTVKRGQKIGEIGSTGSSTGPHCHWEIRDKNGNKTNPAPSLKVGHWV